MTLPRTTRLMAGLFLRRIVNRLAAGLARKKPPGGKRTGTGRKAATGIFVMLLVAFVIGVNGVNISFGIQNGLAEALGPFRDAQGRIEIPREMLQELRNLEQWQKDRNARIAESAGVFRIYREFRVPENEAKTRMMQAVFKEKGSGGFTEAQITNPVKRAWTDAAAKPVLARALGLLMLFFAASWFCFSLGSANQDLGKVEWGTEWLFTFPVSGGQLFAAQILGRALADPISWFGVFPFLGVLFYSAGIFGRGLIPSALLGTFYLSLIMSGVRVMGETWLRKRFAPARLKNLQALFTLLGILGMFGFFLLTRGGPFCSGWVEAARWAGDVALFNPFSFSAAVLRLSWPWTAALQVIAAALAVWLAAGGCARMVRDGLVSTPSAYEGTRGGTKRRLGFLPGGIIGKDIRLLLRDRNFLVQTLVAPVLVVGFQVAINGSAKLFSSNFQHASAFAFGLGAYVLISSAMSILAVEGPALWMLYSLPVRLYRIMLRKTFLWGACALGYTVVGLGVFAAGNPSLRPADLGYGAMACAGVAIYAFIAAGLGMLGTDPLAVEVKRRLRVDMVYLYMFLAAMFGYAIYSPSVWSRLAQLILSALLAYALWQKVRDRSPYLLDPVSAPPQEVSLSDGLIAALAFFVLQGTVATAAAMAEMPLRQAVTLAYLTAGIVVWLGALLSFRGNLRALFAFGGPDREPWGRSCGVGVVAGIGAATFGVAYLAALPWFPALERLIKAAPEPMLGGGWLLVLAVGLAPVAEEFIFRGLVFAGMRRSLPLTVSAVGSAAIFAICHPPVSVIPVFGLGIFTALAYERTGRLTAPIVAHMVYNAVMLSCSR